MTNTEKIQSILDAHRAHEARVERVKQSAVRWFRKHLAEPDPRLRAAYLRECQQVIDVLKCTS